MQNLGQLLSNHTQAMSKLKLQMSQLAYSLSERPNGTLPSQPLINHRNSSQANMNQDQPLNQCNVVHTLRLEK